MIELLPLPFRWEPVEGASGYDIFIKKFDLAGNLLSEVKVQAGTASPRKGSRVDVDGPQTFIEVVARGVPEGTPKRIQALDFSQQAG